LFLGTILGADVDRRQVTLTTAGITLPANFKTSQTVAQALAPFPKYKSISDT
jgi:hypothetical protein